MLLLEKYGWGVKSQVFLITVKLWPGNAVEKLNDLIGKMNVVLEKMGMWMYLFVQVDLHVFGYR